MYFLKGLAAAGLISVLGACSDNNHTTTTQAITENAAAHWLTSSILVLEQHADADTIKLIAEDQSQQIQEFELTPTKLTAKLTAKYPHLVNLAAYTSTKALSAPTLLQGKLKIEQYQNGKLLTVSRLQTYGILDDLFTSGPADADEVSDYGATIVADGVQFKLWAPTANTVNVFVFDKNKTQQVTLPLTKNESTGVWQGMSTDAKQLDYYQYQISVYHPVSDKFELLTVTDPYSLSLSTNSKYSQIIDLNDTKTAPTNWFEHEVPTVESPEDLLLYEMHIRDFSAADKNLSSSTVKGKYQAFSETQSDGIKHLNLLKQAGLNTLHLLPTYDLSTINEDTNYAIDIDDSVSKMCQLVDVTPYCKDEKLQSLTVKQLLTSFSDDKQAQDVMEQIRGYDNYNWGYDPYHYTVPEGSYATNPEGKQRIVEFRQMVQSIHEMGFRVIMDVVYNHTFASGLAEKSVLDKVVPGYYHRYNIISGAIETSTCCDNSATEHAMMEKLMTDSLVVWAQDYKIDGFRFDLMGHQPKDAMLRARDAVHAVDSDSYFYGEGWNFGEVANNAQFTQASQNELAGTEIGTFTDRLRDAIRGGNFMTAKDGLRRDQGIGNGLYVLPNDLQPADYQYQEYLLSMDQLRVGLAGNLKSYPVKNNQGNIVTGAEVLYGGAPSGYAEDPADTVNYVSKHDNQTLWDNNQYRLPYDMSSDNRVRIHSLSLAYPLLSQGIPFLHMGAELMRSKSFLRDSYDYGDWFNFVDFGYQSNNYDVGLPPAEKDADNWPVIEKLLKENGNNDDVTPEQIKRSALIFADFIKVRTSSKLFRLTTAEQIKQSVSFHNTGKDHIAGLLVMELKDQFNLDKNHDSIVVVFNNNADAKVVQFKAQGYQLHPIQQTGTDSIVKTAKAMDTGFTVPGLTVAIFVK